MRYNLGIVILNFGEPNLTIELVNKLISYKKEFAICVVDNFSNKKNSSKIQDAFKDNKNTYLIMNNKNYFYAKGNNIGLKYCFEEIGCNIAFVFNPDIDILNINFSDFNNINFNNKILITGNIIQNNKLSNLHLFNRFTSRSQNISTKAKLNNKHPIFPSGCCLGMTRAMWKDSGGFYEHKAAYFEELDFIYRFKTKNLYFPHIEIIHSLEIIHHEGGTTGASSNFFKKSLFTDYWSTWSRLRFSIDHNLIGLPSAAVQSLIQVILNIFFFRFKNAFVILKALIGYKFYNEL